MTRRLFAALLTGGWPALKAVFVQKKRERAYRRRLIPIQIRMLDNCGNVIFNNNVIDPLVTTPQNLFIADREWMITNIKIVTASTNLIPIKVCVNRTDVTSEPPTLSAGDMLSVRFV